MLSRIPYRAVLFDLEGTLYDDAGPVPGAPETVAGIRRAGLQVRYVTNTTRRSRAGLVRRLREMGFEAAESELFTAVSAAAAWCRSENKSSVLPLIAREALEDLEGVRLVDASGLLAERPSPDVPDAILVGDLGAEWTYEKLNVAFRCLNAGAMLAACQRNRYWKTTDGLSLDAGPFVAALEYAAGTEAVVVGKPSPIFFRSALDGLEIASSEAIMIGDDAEVDVGGAIASGLSGWLVRTGKYRPGDESRAAPWPECVLDSVVELPRALGIG
jgi:phospholysine phosphohistidine inorganic pyrophosphate phosphatase